MSEWVIVALSHCQMCNFSAISWRGQVIYWWDHDVGFVQDQHAYLDFVVLAHWKTVSVYICRSTRTHYPDSEPKLARHAFYLVTIFRYTL